MHVTMTLTAPADLLSEEIIDRLPLGVVVLDRRGVVLRYNRHEEHLARRRREDVIGRSWFEDVARCTNVPAIAGKFRAHIDSNTLEEDIEHAFPLAFLPRPREVRILLRSFVHAGEPHAVVLIEDIFERKEAERRRDALTAILVHDLRNPLGAILGSASILQMDPRGGVEPIDTIVEAAERMRDLIAATLADIRAGTAAGREASAPVNLHALVLSAIAGALPLARARGLRIFYGGRELTRAAFPEATIAVPGSPERLASVVENLLGNALKYARSEIRIALDPLGERVRLVVADDGRGIPADLRERVFERGFQAPGSLPGSGIGLFSVRQAVEAHRGTAEAAGAEGEGAKLTVWLPGR